MSKPTPKTETLIAGFCTKYALTKGIFPVEVRQEEDYFYAKRGDLGMVFGMLQMTKKTFFESREDAEENARQQAVKKIASLEKSLKKMRVLGLTPKWRQEE